MKKLLWAVTLVLLSQQQDRRMMLPTGQALRPAGRQLHLDKFPMSAVLTPDRKHVLILQRGGDRPSVAVFDAKSMTEISGASFDDAWLGLAVHPTGRTVYVGGASRHNIHELTLSADGRLMPSRVFDVTPPPDRKASDFVGDIALSPDGRLIYAADLFNNAVKVINPQSGRVIENFKTARRPYKILFHPDGRTFFVSSWADGTVTQHDSQTGTVVNRVGAGPHATDMVWRDKKTGDEESESDQFQGRIFVTLGNANTVRVIGVNPSKEMRAIEAINVALYPESPAGMTPSALALSEDRDTLYAVCSDAHAVAAIGVSTSRSRVAGFIPTGWYPTAARALDNGRLLVLNGGGNLGSASLIDAGDPASLIGWTDIVRRNTPYIEEKLHFGHRGDRAIVPAVRADLSPIEHIVYIVKGNRSYDEVLGARGNARLTPNHHKLAAEFTRLDNFHAIAGSGAAGYHWTTAAIAPDFVQRLLLRGDFGFEGEDPASQPPAGHIWTNAAAKGLRIRNYGYTVVNRPLREVNDGIHAAAIRDRALEPVTYRAYRGPDPEYLDVDRAKAYIADLGRMEGEKRFPQFSILRLGNGRSSAGYSGKRSLQSIAADNDAALGMIVDKLSHSSFWPKMAIFVVEESNAAGGGNSSRSPAFVISPYARRAATDSTFYNSASALRTMELILGLNPMTIHDAGAPPMIAAFTPFPDPKPYTAENPNVSLESRPVAQNRALPLLSVTNSLTK